MLKRLGKKIFSILLVHFLQKIKNGEWLMAGFNAGLRHHCAQYKRFCLYCCFTSQVNSYGHCGMVSSPNHTYFLGKLEQAVNQ